MIYVTCPDCGAHLDPGERCDCDTVTHKADTNIDMEETQDD